MGPGKRFDVVGLGLNSVDLLCRALALLLSLALAGCWGGPPAESISGTISVAPELQERAAKIRTLFIIARPEGGGLPLAVQRLVRPRFPFRYYLTADDQMLKVMPFRGRLHIIARLSASGMAGRPRPGDLEGRFRGNPARVGQRGVDILIDKAY
ncbi:MAG: hypothetical protein ACE5JJ_02200 [Nitrospinota bacterium]